MLRPAREPPLFGGHDGNKVANHHTRSEHAAASDKIATVADPTAQISLDYHRRVPSKGIASRFCRTSTETLQQQLHAPDHLAVGVIAARSLTVACGAKRTLGGRPPSVETYNRSPIRRSKIFGVEIHGRFRYRADRNWPRATGRPVRDPCCEDAAGNPNRRSVCLSTKML